MVLSQADENPPVLVYEASVCVLLLAIHREFCELVGEGWGGGEQEKNKMQKQVGQ